MGHRSASLVVVGASLAGLKAVTAARAQGFDGRLVLVGAEHHLPYDRPPLSKAYLMGETEDTALAGSAGLTDELGVELHLGVAATSLDARRAILETTGGPIEYDRLVIATGSTAVVPPFARGGELAGVHVLRSKEDAAAIRTAVAPGSSVLVVGAGFIGAEVASACRRLGARVRIVEATTVPLARAVGAVGPLLSRLHSMHGVELLTGTSVEALRGGRAVRSALLSNGEESPADLVIIGVGAVPATRWLADSAVELHPGDGGVLCDATLATTAPGVWAAGDVVRWPNNGGPMVRMENWTNASMQGGHAARNAVADGRTPYSTTPYCWTDWYSHQIQFAGAALSDSVEIAGSLAAGRLIALYRDDSRLTGVLTVNEPGKIMKLRRVIDRAESWDIAQEMLASWGYSSRPLNGAIPDLESDG